MSRARSAAREVARAARSRLSASRQWVASTSGGRLGPARHGQRDLPVNARVIHVGAREHGLAHGAVTRPVALAVALAHAARQIGDAQHGHVATDAVERQAGGLGGHLGGQRHACVAQRDQQLACVERQVLDARPQQIGQSSSSRRRDALGEQVVASQRVDAQRVAAPRCASDAR